MYPCRNRLEVQGPRRQVRKFCRRVRDKNGFLSLDTIIAPPRHLRHSVNVHALEKWRREHWGTPLNVLGAVFYNHDGPPASTKLPDTVETFHFATEYMPPEPWVETVSAAYPSLRFSLWYDILHEDAGGLHYVGGHLVETDSWKYRRSYLMTTCAVINCERPITGATAHARQADRGLAPNAACCSEHKLEEAVITSERAHR